MFGDVTSNPLHRSCRKYVEVVAFQTTVVMQSLKMAFFEIRASQLGICVRAIFELKFAHTNTHNLTSRAPHHLANCILGCVPLAQTLPSLRIFATDLQPRPQGVSSSTRLTVNMLEIK